MKFRVNSKQAPRTKMCTFCEYWYDPTNSNITPYFGGWEYESTTRKMCMARDGLLKPASSTCSRFKSKV